MTPTIGLATPFAAQCNAIASTLNLTTPSGRELPITDRYQARSFRLGPDQETEVSIRVPESAKKPFVFKIARKRIPIDEAPITTMRSLTGVWQPGKSLAILKADRSSRRNQLLSGRMDFTMTGALQGVMFDRVSPLTGAALTAGLGFYLDPNSEQVIPVQHTGCNDPTLFQQGLEKWHIERTPSGFKVTADNACDLKPLLILFGFPHNKVQRVRIVVPHTISPTLVNNLTLLDILTLGAKIKIVGETNHNRQKGQKLWRPIQEGRLLRVADKGFMPHPS
jgi:hypothetical protein